MRFSAAKLHLVASAPPDVRLRVSTDSGAARKIETGRPTLYNLLDGDAYGERLLSVMAEMPGLSCYSATFS